jgi:hypothetical protein
MPDPPSLRRPSDRPDELRNQLLRQLNRLDKEGGGGEPDLLRAYLQHAQTLAWQGVAEGRMEAPRELLDALRAAEPFVAAHLAVQPDPAANAALEVHFTLRSLQLAVEALEERRVEDRLADERSRTEREVLRVLFSNRGRYLRRGIIHSRLELQEPPTPARVGQILVELHYEGLLQRIFGRAQGNPNAAFYALSPSGVEVCHSLFEGESDAEDLERISEAVNVALDPAREDVERQIVVNQLAARSIGRMGPSILQILKRMAVERGPEAERLYREAFARIQQMRRIAATGGKGWTVEQTGANPGTLVFDPMSKGEQSALHKVRELELAGV